MAAKQDGPELSVAEAVDNLSTLAELTSQLVPEEAFALEGEGLQWQDPSKKLQNREVVKRSFRAIHQYLENLCEKEKQSLEDPRTQRGLQAIMVLAGEAVQKVDRCTSLFRDAHGGGSILQLKEYRDLQSFYLKHIAGRFQQALALEEEWKAQWGELSSEDLVDIERRGLKDLEMIRRDRDYELFYIKKEDGHPFFNRNLVRHLRLVGNFDELLTAPEGEDPLLRIRLIQDREFRVVAHELLLHMQPYMDAFYKEAMRCKDRKLIAVLNKALMALMLASNSRNLLAYTTGKSCHSYFVDFQTYFRETLESTEFQEIVRLPDVQEPLFQHVSQFVRALCGFLYMRLGHRTEMMRFITWLIRGAKGGRAIESAQRAPLSVWHLIMEDDELIRHVLRRYPSGPILKTLDLLSESEPIERFDPLLQDNLPVQLYEVSSDAFHFSVLRIPSPCVQEAIQRARVIPEFLGFLRSLANQGGGKTHLLVNLQDRTSWQEYARCIALEELHKRAEYAAPFLLVTLPTRGDFYQQAGSYLAANDADQFLGQLAHQIESAEQCGYFFPSVFASRELVAFAQRAARLVHQIFFEGAKTLSRKQRIDLLEIFTHLLVCKLVEWGEVDSLSFTCKDAVDVGSATGAGFFALLRMWSMEHPLSSSEVDFLQWMLFAPALQIRERAIDLATLSRMVSSTALVHAALTNDRMRTLEGIASLFEPRTLTNLRVQYIAPPGESPGERAG